MLTNTPLKDWLGNHVTGRNGTRGFERTELGYQHVVDALGVPRAFPYQQHPLTLDDNGRNVGEDFADMFMNWVQNSFDYSPEASGAGYVRYHWMTTNMSEWVSHSGQR
jgi:hypothetical protein